MQVGAVSNGGKGKNGRVWLAFENLNLKLTVSRQHNGVMSTVMARTWTRRVGVLQR